MAQDIIWVVGSTPFHGSRRYSYQRPTQKQAVYEAVKAAGAAGVTNAGIATALASTQFDKGVGCSLKNVAFYTNHLRKHAHIAEKGTASAVSPAMGADDALFAALVVLENALVAKAKERGLTEEMRGEYLIYKKCLALALAPGTPGEGRNALAMAIKKILNIVL